MKLKPVHNLDSFESTQPSINDWLRTRASRALEDDTAQTYVVCRGTRRVVAYYSLAAGAIEHVNASGALRRNAPDPIPVIILARLGVDKSEAGKGLGQDITADAMKRAVRAARIIGAKALVVHALNEKAAVFYEKLGFRAIDGDRQTLFLPMASIRKNL